MTPSRATRARSTSRAPTPDRPLLPSNYTFVAGDNGSHTFTNGVTLKTAGSQTVTVNDTVETSRTGTATINVSAAAADHFRVTAPATATAGTAFNTVTLTAQDLYNNTATGYANGNHAITWSGASTSPGGNAPSYPTSTVSFTNGVSTTTLSATLFAAGSNSLTATATSPSLTGTATINVSAAAADHFKVTAPATATAGTAFNTVTLTAQDLYNNTATGYANGNHAITWSGASTSPGGNAPSYPTSTVSFTNGVSTTTLSATLFAAGSNSLTATATSPSLTGTATINVEPGRGRPLQGHRAGHRHGRDRLQHGHAHRPGSLQQHGHGLCQRQPCDHLERRLDQPGRERPQLSDQHRLVHQRGQHHDPVGDPVRGRLEQPHGNRDLAQPDRHGDDQRQLGRCRALLQPHLSGRDAQEHFDCVHDPRAQRRIRQLVQERLGRRDRAHVEQHRQLRLRHGRDGHDDGHHHDRAGDQHLHRRRER